MVGWVWRTVKTKGLSMRYSLNVGGYSAWLNQECYGCGKSRVTFWVATIYDESHNGAMEIRSSRAYFEFGGRPFKERSVRNLKRWSEDQLRALCPAVLRDLEAPYLIAPSRTRPSQSRREVTGLVSAVRLVQRSILVCVQAVALTTAISAVAKAFEVLEEQKEYLREIKRYANDVY